MESANVQRMVFVAAVCSVSASCAKAQTVPRHILSPCDVTTKAIALRRSHDANGAALVIDEPTATVAGNGVVLAGHSTLVHAVGFRGVGAALIDSTGRTLSQPPAAANGIRPELATIGDTLFYVWGQAKDAPSILSDGRQAWPPPVTAVWFATRVRGGEWSQPKQLIGADYVLWGGTNTAVIRGPDASLHVAIAGASRASGFKLIHAELKPGEARITDIKAPGPAAYPRLAWLRDTAFIVFTSILDEPGDLNSVFVARRDPGTRSWGGPVLVSRSGPKQAHATRILAHAGALHLVWGQSVDAGSSVEVLRHVMSRDGGNSWSSPTDLKTGDVAVDALVPLDAAHIAVVYVSLAGDAPSLTMACWADQGWRQPRPLVKDLAVVAPRLVSGTERVLVGRALPSGARQSENVLIVIPN
jgi:hypothetical protein